MQITFDLMLIIFACISKYFAAVCEIFKSHVEMNLCQQHIITQKIDK